MEQGLLHELRREKNQTSLGVRHHISLSISGIPQSTYLGALSAKSHRIDRGHTAKTGRHTRQRCYQAAEQDVQALVSFLPNEYQQSAGYQIAMTSHSMS